MGTSSSHTASPRQPLWPQKGAPFIAAADHPVTFLQDFAPHSSLPPWPCSRTGASPHPHAEPTHSAPGQPPCEAPLTGLGPGWPSCPRAFCCLCLRVCLRPAVTASVHTHPDILPFLCLSWGLDRHHNPPVPLRLVLLAAHEPKIPLQGSHVNFSFALSTVWELSNC